MATQIECAPKADLSELLALADRHPALPPSKVARWLLAAIVESEESRAREAEWTRMETASEKKIKAYAKTALTALRQGKSVTPIKKAHIELAGRSDDAIVILAGQGREDEWYACGEAEEN